MLPRHVLHKYIEIACSFLSPILTESRLISFPKGTKMFQFPLCESLCGFPRWVFVPFSRFVLDTTFRIV